VTRVVYDARTQGQREIARTAARAIDVLLLLADRGGAGLTVRDMSTMLHAPRTSVADLLKVLSARRFVSPSAASGQWRLDFRALQLANAYLQQFPLRDAARTWMRDLSNETGLPCQMAVLDDNEIVYIERQDATRRSDLRIVTDLGSRLPAHCTALGKAVLAHMSKAEVEELFGGLTPWPVRTKNSISSFPRLRDELNTVQRRGYALDIEEAFSSLVCAGAAILGADQRPEAAISLVGLRSQLSMTDLHALGVRVARAAAEISAVRGAATPITRRSVNRPRRSAAYREANSARPTARRSRAALSR
jgi:DNA-binding IclR family transcriptional regulator